MWRFPCLPVHIATRLTPFFIDVMGQPVTTGVNWHDLTTKAVLSSFLGTLRLGLYLNNGTIRLGLRLKSGTIRLGLRLRSGTLRYILCLKSETRSLVLFLRVEPFAFLPALKHLLLPRNSCSEGKCAFALSRLRTL